MQVQSVGKYQTNLNFKSSVYVDEESLVDMRNSDLKSLAYYLGSDSKKDKKRRDSIIKTFCAIPIVDTLASGILAAKLIAKYKKIPNSENAILEEVKIKGASLAERTSIMGGKAAFWGVAILGVIAYNKAKHALFPQTYEPGGYSQKHPVMSFITDLGLILAGFVLGEKALEKGIESLDKNHPEFVSKIAKNTEKAFKWIDKSAANKKLLPWLEKRAVNFAHRAPGLTLIGMLGLALSVPILLVVGVYKTIKYDRDERQRIQENYLDLKRIQLKMERKMARGYRENHCILLAN